MIDMKKYGFYIVGGALVIGAAVLLVKLISGALKLVGGLLNAVLGIAVVLALVAIVVWMFRYAKKK